MGSAVVTRPTLPPDHRSPPAVTALRLQGAVETWPRTAFWLHGAGAGRQGPTVARVRLTQFRSLMDDEFGPVRAASLARDHVLADLGGRTVEDALEAGLDPRTVWRAVCDAFDVPPGRR